MHKTDIAEMHRIDPDPTLTELMEFSAEQFK